MNWTTDALCYYVSEDSKKKFFSEEPEDVQDALEICDACPVRQTCLQNALDNNERWGVWGGATQEELRTAQAIDEDGKPDKSVTMQCPRCKVEDTSDLYIIEKNKAFTQVACSYCGTHWKTRKIITRTQGNW